MNSLKLKIGVVGMGSMGSDHARRILAGEVPNMELAGVCDADESRLASWKSRSVPTFTSYASLLASDIQAVLIATPHFSHVPFGVSALKAGLHVLVEKPIAVQKADAEQLLAAHDKPSQIFAAMFNQRTDPLYIKIRQLLDAGELGKIQRVTWIITDWYRPQSYYDSSGWRATWAGEGGGVLINQCPHQLDIYQWLFGLPAKVRAFCHFGRYHDIEVEDSVTAYFEHADGASTVLITTTGEAPGTNRLEIAGERGKLVAEGGKLHYSRNEIPSGQHIRTSPGIFSRPDVWEIEIPISGRGEQHVGILKNFAGACLQGEPLIAPAADGLRSVELANAMLLSSAQEITITLPLQGAEYARWLAGKIAESRFQQTPPLSAELPSTHQPRRQPGAKASETG